MEVDSIRVDRTQIIGKIESNMTTAQTKRLEKMASESMRYARRAIVKSNEMQAILSLMEAKAGKVKQYSSVDDIFRKLKI